MSDTPRTDDQIGCDGSTMSAIRIEFCRQLERELNTANERIKRLEAVVNDPHALWSNWLRGDVKLPEGIGDVRQYQDRIKQLEEQLWLTLNEPRTPDAFIPELAVRENLYGAKPHTKERPSREI